MRLSLDPAWADGYQSASQRARRLSERWFATEMYCVACGADSVMPHGNNARANDFFCSACGAHVELKSGSRPLGHSVPDGAFSSMVERLQQPGGGPHLALLRYCPSALAVLDLTVLPASLLTKKMIVPRAPLKPTARRAGWIGCNIRIGDVPPAGRVAVVRDGTVMPKAAVVARLQRATAVRGDLESRSWLVDTLRCVERVDAEFGLADVYAFERDLRERHPGNLHIRAKLRQQLQRLRDAGFIEFLGSGRHRRVED